MRFVPAARLADLPDPGLTAVEVDGRSLLLCRSEGAIYAVSNRCTHADSRLEGGRLRGIHLYCPLHGARYDLRDGSTPGPLARRPLDTYAVRVVDGRVEVELPAADDDQRW